MSFDAIIVGAGFAGAVAARELAERGGKKVLVLERRDHIGGNAYDCLDQAGVLIHQYGPHIFHTNNKRVYDYLSRFTAWREYQHRVVADIPMGEGRGHMPVPFNLTSLEIAFGKERAQALERKLIEECGRLQVPGRPRLYRTTKNFLRAFHLTTLEDLPDLPGMEAEGQLRLGDDGALLDGDVPAEERTAKEGTAKEGTAKEGTAKESTAEE